jgi:hypothetical protein
MVKTKRIIKKRGGIMKKIDLKDAVGKTFLGFVQSDIIDQSILKFSDECYSVFAMSQDNYDGQLYLYEDDLDLLCFGDDKLSALGIASKAELENMRKENIEKKKYRDEELERKEYERLKKKFEQYSDQPEDYMDFD